MTYKDTSLELQKELKKYLDNKGLYLREVITKTFPRYKSDFDIHYLNLLNELRQTLDFEKTIKTICMEILDVYTLGGLI